jgi:hypothetical protein
MNTVFFHFSPTFQIYYIISIFEEEMKGGARNEMRWNKMGCEELG